MAWRRTGAKPLPQHMKNTFMNAIGHSQLKTWCSFQTSLTKTMEFIPWIHRILNTLRPRLLSRWQFQTHFLVWKLLYFEWNFIELCSSIGSDNAFESYRRRAIIWINIGLVWWGVYRQTSNICRILVDNKIVDHSDVVGAPPLGAAPTTSSFSI